jgi:hypothetical protein
MSLSNFTVPRALIRLTQRGGCKISPLWDKRVAVVSVSQLQRQILHINSNPEIPKAMDQGKSSQLPGA